ncbi:MAG TPA: response regulator transcription factor [Saprospiraceae bacterium]|nr:response regulator transcription factor [Saprospiraceae bacterium]
MKKIILRFGLLAASLLVLFQLGKYSLIVTGFSTELLLTLFGFLFVAVGIAAGKILFFQPSLQQTENDKTALADAEAILNRLNISRRELEVLMLVAKGFSNLEIARQLFISESTVKTHVSNLLLKLDAKRRTEAVQKAKNLGLIP